MDSIIRAIIIYVVFLFYLRITGKKSLSQTTAFDFVTLLIIAEVTDEALTGTAPLTNTILVAGTLIGLDIIFSFLKGKFKWFDKAIDSVPLIIVKDGKVLKQRIDAERIDEGDILEAARKLRGLERMEQIKYAVLEKDGSISIIPK
jgi:uncharacterized membrane protein YcaP (DUF421 family)